MPAYINHYILIYPKQDSQRHFQYLVSLLTELGLPSNPDKQTPLCHKLTCLSIYIDLDTNTLSIPSDKLQSIYSDCLDLSTRRQLTRTHYQSLLGKLLYIQKCVRPAHIFINKMLALFGANHGAKIIALISDFHKDLKLVFGFSAKEGYPYF